MTIGQKIIDLIHSGHLFSADNIDQLVRAEIATDIAAQKRQIEALVGKALVKVLEEAASSGKYNAALIGKALDFIYGKGRTDSPADDDPSSELLQNIASARSRGSAIPPLNTDDDDPATR